MKRWAGPLFVLLLAATAPLLAPPSARSAGLWPDVAVLAVVFLGFRATPERAALFGVAAGALSATFSVEPFLLRPFVLGTAGFLAGQAAGILHRDENAVRMAVAAAAVLFVRGAEEVAAALACGGAADWDGAVALRMAGTGALAAVTAALAAPLWFGLVRGWRLLAPLERSFRDV